MRENGLRARKCGGGSWMRMYKEKGKEGRFFSVQNVIESRFLHCAKTNADLRLF